MCVSCVSEWGPLESVGCLVQIHLVPQGCADRLCTLLQWKAGTGREEEERGREAVRCESLQ